MFILAVAHLLHFAAASSTKTEANSRRRHTTKLFYTNKQRQTQDITTPPNFST